MGKKHAGSNSVADKETVLCLHVPNFASAFSAVPVWRQGLNYDSQVFCEPYPTYLSTLLTFNVT